MRMRSPRSAPPVRALDWSTATMATVLDSRRNAAARRSTRVLFPAPGGPVTPRISARWLVSERRSSRSRREPGSPFSMAVAARESARISPAAIFFAQSCINRGLVFQKLTGDNQALNFAGSLTDGAQLDVAIEFLHRIILDESVSAVDLHRFVSDSHGGL